MAFWAVSIFAGVVGVCWLVAGVALVQMAAHGFSATLDDVLDDAFVGRKHGVAVFCEVGVAKLAKDVGNFNHGWSPFQRPVMTLLRRMRKDCRVGSVMWV